MYGLVTAQLGATDVIALCEAGSVARRDDDTAALLHELWLAKGSLEAAAGRGHVRAMAALLAEGRVPRLRDCTAAAGGGHIPALELLRAQAPPCPWGALVTAQAAELSDRSTLEWLCDPARDPPCPCDCRASVAAAGRGDLDTLKWLSVLPHATVPVPVDDEILPRREEDAVFETRGNALWQLPGPGGYTDMLPAAAALGGHLETLQWINDCIPVPVGEPRVGGCVAFAAGHGGSLGVLRCLRDLGCPWDAAMCHGAAMGNHPNALRWLHAEGCQWDSRTTLAVAAVGNLGMLEWLHTRDCPMHTDCSTAAAHAGHMGAVRWLDGHSCPADRDALFAPACRHGNIAMLEWLRTRDPAPFPVEQVAATLCGIAANCNNLALLKWLRAPSTGGVEGRPHCPWCEGVTQGFARHGNRAALEWVRQPEHRCPWDSATCAAAAGRNDVPLLEWLRAPHDGLRGPPCPRGNQTCAAAAHGGHMATLEWLRAPHLHSIRGPPCDWGGAGACYAAARAGCLAMLQWMRRPQHWPQRGEPCPWGEHFGSVAAQQGHLRLLQWVVREPCVPGEPDPWNAGVSHGLTARDFAVAKWLLGHNPPLANRAWQLRLKSLIGQTFE